MALGQLLCTTLSCSPSDIHLIFLYLNVFFLSEYTFSISGKVGNHTGRVEVQSLGVRGRVCREGWDDRDAAVLCRSQGFTAGIAYAHFK